MAKCQKCNKPSKETKALLTNGANGFRKYNLCPACQKSAGKSTK